MLLGRLREEVYRANVMLVEAGLVELTWGNASGIDRASGLVVIKPSGVACDDMVPSDLAVVDLSGAVVEGSLRPSSDTPTHLELYRAWPELGGVAHTHSVYATAHAQAAVAIPCHGTTHADFCPGDIPCVRALTREEVESGYEANTGRVVVAHYAERGMRPLAYPGALLSYHGPFTWGAGAVEASENAIALETIARMACLTRRINPDAAAIPGHIMDKHYARKHGPSAYYGQRPG